MWNRKFLVFILLLGLIACGVKKPSSVDLAQVPSNSGQKGYASWYGPGFHGKTTASGEVYNMRDRTAAHRSLAFGTKVRVFNLESGKSTVVRVNDRGPFVRGRIIDLSRKAAKDIGLLKSGVAKVQIEPIGSKAHNTGPSNSSASEASRPLTVSSQPKNGSYLIQLGSFRSEKNAESLKYELQHDLGDKRFFVKRNARLYKVFQGPYPSRAQAEKSHRQLKRLGYSSFVLQTK